MVADDTRRSYVNDVMSGYREWVQEQGSEDITLTLASFDQRAVDRVITRLREERADAVCTEF